MPKNKFVSDEVKRMPRHAAMLGMLVLASSCVPVGSATRPVVGAPVLANGGESQQRSEVLPVPVPLVLQPVAAETAMALNAAIPVSDAYNPAARAFTLRTRGAIDRMRSIDCLTTAIYYEAASESEDGQRAVAQVVLNRVRHPTYPNSVCGVVYQGSERSSGCQFSFTCDGSLLRTPASAAWARARRIAESALAGNVFAPVGHATHYHTKAVLPYWASSLVKSAVIGAHIFYRWNGKWGDPPAFRQTYAGIEPIPGPKARQANMLLPFKPVLQTELIGAAASPKLAMAEAYLALPPQERKPSAGLPKAAPSDSRLPDSQIREEYRYSGVPRDELPAQMR